MTHVTPDFSQSRPVATTEGKTPKEMLTVRMDGGKTFVSINPSSLSILQSCPRKAYYYLNEGYRTAGGESPALTFGTAIHKALETFYLCAPSGERHLPADFRGRAAALAAGADSAEFHLLTEEHYLFRAIGEFVTAAEPLRILPDTDKRSIAGGIWTLTHYFETYLNDPYEIMQDDDGPITERLFRSVIYDSTDLQITLFGTIDCVLRHRVTGQILPCDHKTTSALGSEFFNRLKPNHQYSAYVLGVQAVLGFPNASEFLVNGIQVKPRPLTSRGGPPNFTRQITTRSAEDLNEFREVVITEVRRYLASCSANSFPLGPVDSCAMWGGCMYHEVCRSPESLRENILRASFSKEN